MVQVKTQTQKVLVNAYDKSVKTEAAGPIGPPGDVGPDASDVNAILANSDLLTKTGGALAPISRSNLANDTAFTSKYVEKTTLTADGQVLSRASGLLVPITRADLANDTAFTSKYIEKSLVTTDGDLITRTAGAPARMTRDTLAQDNAFSSRYQPINRLSCLVSKTTGQSISNNTWTAVSWNSETFDNGGLHDNVTNNSRITIPTLMGGLWLVGYSVSFDTNVNGLRETRIRQSGGSAYLAYTVYLPASHGYAAISAQQLIRANAADYFELMVYQDSGVALNVRGDNTVGLLSNFWAYRISG